jgi:hypothetical protein
MSGTGGYTTELRVDLHGYFAHEIAGYALECLIEQAYEIGAERLCLVHGHGRNRATGIRAGTRGCSFNTGYFGLRVREELQCPSVAMRKYIGSTVVDQWDTGKTYIRLKLNPQPTRTELDLSVLPKTRERRNYEEELAWQEHRRCKDAAA